MLRLGVESQPLGSMLHRDDRAPERFMRVVIEHALRLPCMSSAALDTH